MAVRIIYAEAYVAGVKGTWLLKLDSWWRLICGLDLWSRGPGVILGAGSMTNQHNTWHPRTRHPFMRAQANRAFRLYATSMNWHLPWLEIWALAIKAVAVGKSPTESDAVYRAHCTSNERRYPATLQSSIGTLQPLNDTPLPLCESSTLTSTRWRWKISPTVQVSRHMQVHAR